VKERLFVPLSKEPYRDFLLNGKEVEIRKYGRSFTEKTVFPGRRIELRLGYSGKSAIWGNINEVIVGTLEDIFNIMICKSRARVKMQKRNFRKYELLGSSDKYIGFSVKLIVDKFSNFENFYLRIIPQMVER
jgi:hypothetical protein